jgi:hypothetical protein
VNESNDTWYVRVVNRNPDANEILVKEVIGADYAEELCQSIKCADGKKRKLYRLPKGVEQVREAKAAAQKYNFKIEVYRETTKDFPRRFKLNEPSAHRARKDSQNMRHVRHAS